MERGKGWRGEKEVNRGSEKEEGEIRWEKEGRRGTLKEVNGGSGKEEGEIRWEKEGGRGRKDIKRTDVKTHYVPGDCTDKPDSGRVS